MLERIDFFLEGFYDLVQILHGFLVPPLKERYFRVGSSGRGDLRL